MAIIAPNTKKILEPFTNFDSEKRSDLESGKDNNNLWCDDKSGGSTQVGGSTQEERDNRNKQILVHVWKICIDICHDFMDSKKKPKPEPAEVIQYWKEISKIGKIVDTLTDTHTLSGAFDEWQSSPFPATSHPNSKKASLEKHGLYALFSPYVTPPDLLEAIYSVLPDPNKQNIIDSLKDILRTELNKDDFDSVDQKGALRMIRTMVENNTFVTSLEASKWSSSNLRVAITYLNGVYRNGGDDTPPPGHDQLGGDRKSFACILDPATRKGHGSLEHFLLELYNNKPTADAATDDGATAATAATAADFFKKCKDCLKESFQHFLNVFINPLTGKNYTINKMIIQSSISGSKSNNNILVEISDAEGAGKWYKHELGQNEISKTGTVVGISSTYTQPTPNGPGNLLISEDPPPANNFTYKPLKDFFSNLSLLVVDEEDDDDVDEEEDDDDVDGPANIFKYSYKSLGDWIQVVYLKKLNKLVRSDYNLNITLSHTSNDKYVAIDSFCAGLVDLITAVKTDNYRVGSSSGGGAAFQLSGGATPPPPPEPTKGIPSMTFLGSTIHKPIHDRDVYTATLIRYGILTSDFEPATDEVVIWDDSGKIIQDFRTKFNEYFDSKSTAEEWSTMLKTFISDTHPHLAVLPTTLYDDSVSIFNKIIFHSLNQVPTIDYDPNKDYGTFLFNSNDKKALFLKELYRFCSAIQAAFDINLITKLQDVYRKVDEISEQIIRSEISLETNTDSSSDDPDTPDNRNINDIKKLIKTVIKSLKLITGKCHELYKLNINELLQHVSYALEVVLTPDTGSGGYGYNDNLKLIFNTAQTKLLTLREGIYTEGPAKIRITKEEVETVFEEGLHIIESNSETKIDDVRASRQGVRSSSRSTTPSFQSRIDDQVNAIISNTQDDKNFFINDKESLLDSLRYIKKFFDDGDSHHIGGNYKRKYEPSKDNHNKGEDTKKMRILSPSNKKTRKLSPIVGDDSYGPSIKKRRTSKREDEDEGQGEGIAKKYKTTDPRIDPLTKGITKNPYFLPYDSLGIWEYEEEENDNEEEADITSQLTFTKSDLVSQSKQEDEVQMALEQAMYEQPVPVEELVEEDEDDDGLSLNGGTFRGSKLINYSIFDYSFFKLINALNYTYDIEYHIITKLQNYLQKDKTKNVAGKPESFATSSSNAQYKSVKDKPYDSPVDVAEIFGRPVEGEGEAELAEDEEDAAEMKIALLAKPLDFSSQAGLAEGQVGVDEGELKRFNTAPDRTTPENPPTLSPNKTPTAGREWTRPPVRPYTTPRTKKVGAEEKASFGGSKTKIKRKSIKRKKRIKKHTRARNKKVKKRTNKKKTKKYKKQKKHKRSRKH